MARFIKFALLSFCACLATGVSAQNGSPHGENVVCVKLDSNYARISNTLPRISDSLVKEIPKRHKGIKVIAIADTVPDVREAASRQGCNYLLEMHVLEVRGTGVGVNNLTTGEKVSADGERDLRELEWVRIDYRLASLHTSDVNLKDSDYVRDADVPSGWDAGAFETTMFRAVTRTAVWSLNKLPKA